MQAAGRKIGIISYSYAPRITLIHSNASCYNEGVALTHNIT